VANVAKNTDQSALPLLAATATTTPAGVTVATLIGMFAVLMGDR
jgi:hypothetical protein